MLWTGGMVTWQDISPYPSGGRLARTTGSDDRLKLTDLGGSLVDSLRMCSNNWLNSGLSECLYDQHMRNMSCNKESKLSGKSRVDITQWQNERNCVPPPLIKLPRVKPGNSPKCYWCDIFILHKYKHCLYTWSEISLRWQWHNFFFVSVFVFSLFRVSVKQNTVVYCRSRIHSLSIKIIIK